MTFREKLQQEHPECCREEFTAGGCEMCPDFYDYEDISICPINHYQELFKNPTEYFQACFNECRVCWDRIIP